VDAPDDEAALVIEADEDDVVEVLLYVYMAYAFT
jgi:hypothetical protein